MDDCGKNKDPALERRLEMAKFVGGVFDVFDRLLRCGRWEGYPNRHQRQTSAHHSLSIALLAAYCLELERKAGKNKIDELLVMTHAVIHEFSEGAIGDIRYVFKHDPRIEEVYEQIEHEETLIQMDRLGFLASFLRRVYCLPAESVEAKFFDAMEKLDYVLYALFEFVGHGNEKFISVFARHHETLVKYAGEFPSVGEIYNAELQSWIEGTLKVNSWALEASEGKIRHLSETDLEAMVRALRSAVGKLASRSSDPAAVRREFARKIKKAIEA